jgi:Flp pilus assembly pilin Flp
MARAKARWSRRARLRGDRGVTSIEYGIMVAVFGVGMLGVGAFLVNQTNASYNASEGRVANPASACIGDEILDTTVTPNVCIPNPVKVTAVNPGSGPQAGGTTITITGEGFSTTGTVAVKVGGVAATGVTVVSATQITAVTAAGTPGIADVAVTNPASGATPTKVAGLTATGWGLFRYLGAVPTLTGIAPTTGPESGGTTITLTGTNFAPGASVSVGGVPATVTNVTATQITAVTPSGTAGAKPVIVTNTDGQATSSVTFTYTAGPRITSVTPSVGQLVGTRTVSIGGTNFVSGATVRLNGVNVTVNSVSATTISADFPGSATTGSVSVQVVNPDGQSFLLPSGYTYAVPVVTTDPPSLVVGSSATLNGRVDNSGLPTASNVSFCLGTSSATNGSGALTSCSAVTSFPTTATGSGDTALTASASVSPSTTYYYQARATNGSQTYYGNVQSFTTLGLPTAPAVTATPGSGSVAVSWSVANTGGSPIQSYALQRAVGTSSSTCGTTWADVALSPVTTTSYTDAQGTAYSSNYYCYRVSATTAGGTSGPTADGPVRPRTVPSAPAMGSVTAGLGSLTVTFTAPTSDGDSPILDYAYSLDGGTTWTTLATSGTAPNLGMTITGLTNGTSYTVRVSARNAIGRSAASGPGTATPACGTPQPPTGLKGIFYDQRMYLSWTAPSDTGGCPIDVYQIQYSSNGSSWSDQTTNAPAETTTTWRNGSNLGTGNHYFRVRVSNDGGEWSSYATVGPIQGCGNNLLRSGTNCLALDQRRSTTVDAGQSVTDNSGPNGSTVQSPTILTQPTAGGTGTASASGRTITYNAPNAVGWTVIYFTYNSGSNDGVLVVEVQ